MNIYRAIRKVRVVTFFLVVLLCLQVIHAQEIKNEEFKAHQVDHIHEGCPTNSSCSEEMGKKRLAWINFLKTSPNAKKLNQFFKRNGTPINFYLLKNLEDNKQVIAWDSRCPNHNLTDHKIALAQKNIKSFKELDDWQSSIAVAHITIAKNDKTILNIPYSQGTFPTYLDKDRLYFILELEGMFYGLTTNAKGQIQVKPAESFEKLPTPIKCPESLVQFASKQINPVHLYSHSYCRKIWDKSSKKYVAALIQLACQ